MRTINRELCTMYKVFAVQVVKKQPSKISLKSRKKTNIYKYFYKTKRHGSTLRLFYTSAWAPLCKHQDVVHWRRYSLGIHTFTECEVLLHERHQNLLNLTVKKDQKCLGNWVNSNRKHFWSVFKFAARVCSIGIFSLLNLPLKTALVAPSPSLVEMIRWIRSHS